MSRLLRTLVFTPIFVATMLADIVFAIYSVVRLNVRIYREVWKDMRP